MSTVAVTVGSSVVATTVGSTVVDVDVGETVIATLVTAGPQGPIGPAGGVPFEHVQATAAATWTITHGRGRYPVPVVLDSAGALVLPDLTYSDLNTAVIVHSEPRTGRAIFI